MTNNSKKSDQSNLGDLLGNADKTLTEINQEIAKTKTMKNKATAPTKEVKIDFDTLDYPEGSQFGKYIFAIPLEAETVERLKAKCTLNNTDVVEYLSELISCDVEESFALNPEEFNEQTFESAHEILSSLIDEKLGVSQNTNTPSLIDVKFGNLTINLNIGGGDEKKQDMGNLLAGLSGLLMGALADSKEEKADTPPVKKEDFPFENPLSTTTIAQLDNLPIGSSISYTSNVSAPAPKS